MAGNLFREGFAVGAFGCRILGDRGSAIGVLRSSLCLWGDLSSSVIGYLSEFFGKKCCE